MGTTRGIIFNIQHFSIHDGPGIRTTVFLKGCPLRCPWCSNPESQRMNPEPMLDAVTKAPGTTGQEKTVDEIIDEVMKDIDFYEESGGGVTISGGEGMVQPDFVKALLAKLKEHKIHTAIETTGYIKKEIFRELAPMFDLLLFDVKHYDSDEHYEGTHVHNELIIENLAWAISQGIEVLPRIPVIPDFNDSLDDAKGIAALLNQVGAKKVQLLPFHQFGENKYHLLGKTYSYENVKALHPEDLTDYQRIFLDVGIDCFF